MYSCVIRFQSSQPLFIVRLEVRRKSRPIRFSNVKLINFNWTLDRILIAVRQRADKNSRTTGGIDVDEKGSGLSCYRIKAPLLFRLLG